MAYFIWKGLFDPKDSLITTNHNKQRLCISLHSTPFSWNAFSCILSSNTVTDDPLKVSIMVAWFWYTLSLESRHHFSSCVVIGNSAPKNASLRLSMQAPWSPWPPSEIHLTLSEMLWATRGNKVTPKNVLLHSLGISLLWATCSIVDVRGGVYFCLLKSVYGIYYEDIILSCSF